jgi:hypothetical protein
MKEYYMTKKNWLLVLCAGLVLAVLLLGGCATSRLFDKKSAKAKEQSVIQLDSEASGGNRSVSIDGKPVVYMGSGSLTLVIPAGEHTVLVSKSRRYTLSSEKSRRGDTVYVQTTYIDYSLKSYTTFEFEPGKRYALENIYPKMDYNGMTLETSDPGVTVHTSQAGAVSVDNPGLKIEEEGTMPFSTYLGYEFQWDGSYFGWTKGIVSNGFGVGFGVSLIHGKLEMKLLGEAGVGIGLSVPDMAALGFGYLVYAGGLAEILFSKTALEFGGGMIAGNNGFMNLSESVAGRNFAAPYLKAGFLFQKGWHQEWGLYGQYFLGSEEEEWYNRFGAGIHFHAH